MARTLPPENNACQNKTKQISENINSHLTSRHDIFLHNCASKKLKKGYKNFKHFGLLLFLNIEIFTCYKIECYLYYYQSQSYLFIYFLQTKTKEPLHCSKHSLVSYLYVLQKKTKINNANRRDQNIMDGSGRMFERVHRKHTNQKSSKYQTYCFKWIHCHRHPLRAPYALNSIP